MARAGKRTASEADGVEYRRAPTWRIAVSQLYAGSAMVFQTLVGLMSYLQNEGYGIAVAVAGVILTVTRIFDGVLNPIVAMIIEKVNFSFGKIRFFLALGWVIRSIAVVMLFMWGSDRGYGIVFFVVMYVLYIVGTTFNDVAGNMMNPVLSNDPRQRPTIGVWATVYQYIFPTVFTLISTVVILPRHGNEYNVAMLRDTAIVFLIATFVLMVCAIVGISDADRPKNYEHLVDEGEEAKVTFRDMWDFLRNNGPFQRFVIAAVSDKIAQQVTAQAVVTTMFYGILLGNIQIGAILSMVTMLPSIVFAIVGAKYTGKHGSKKATITWTWACIGAASALTAMFLLVDTRDILKSIPLMALFIVLQIALNGFKMCVTSAATSMRSDIVDYELDRSGKNMPAVVSATYNFVDHIVSSLGNVIALGGIALIGYTTVMPQPNDDLATAVLLMTLVLMFGVPVLGWICTLLVMPGFKIDRQGMIDIQQRITTKKIEIATRNITVVK